MGVLSPFATHSCGESSCCFARTWPCLVVKDYPIAACYPIPDGLVSVGRIRALGMFFFGSSAWMQASDIAVSSRTHCGKAWRLPATIDGLVSMMRAVRWRPTSFS